MSADVTATRPPVASQRSWRVLGQRDFGLYFAGNLASNCGTWFQNIAQTLLVFRLTHSVFLVGLVNFAQFIGITLLSPWSGTAADRFDRRRLLLATQVAACSMSAGMAAVTAARLASPGVVIALAVLLGLTTAFAIPAVAALVPTLVPRADVPAAVAMNTVSFTLAIAFGPLAGALLIARWGLAPAFAANSVSYLVLVAALLVIRPAPRPRQPVVRASLPGNLRILRSDAAFLPLLAIVACVAVSGDPVNTLSPSFVTAIYHHADVWTGALLGSVGLGAAIAALSGPAPGSRRRMRGTAALMGLSMIGFALSPNLAVGLVALGLAGYGFLATQVNATTRLQMAVDEGDRGRLMALWSVAWLGLRPFASLADGALGRLVGLRPAAAILALPVLASVLFLRRVAPDRPPAVPIRPR